MISYDKLNFFSKFFFSFWCNCSCSISFFVILKMILYDFTLLFFSLIEKKKNPKKHWNWKQQTQKPQGNFFKLILKSSIFVEYFFCYIFILPRNQKNLTLALKFSFFFKDFILLLLIHSVHYVLIYLFIYFIYSSLRGPHYDGFFDI